MIDVCRGRKILLANRHMCSGGAGLRHGSQETPLCPSALLLHLHDTGALSHVFVWTFALNLQTFVMGLACNIGTLSPYFYLPALFVYIELTHTDEAISNCLPVCVFHPRNYWKNFEEFGIRRVRPTFVRRNWFRFMLIQYQFSLHQETL
jgi:hypothetical protein